MGNGVVEGVEEIMEEWGPKEVFGIDLDMRGSEELWGEEFEWRAEGGMGENARKVMEEFEKKMSVYLYFLSLFYMLRFLGLKNENFN